MAASLPLVPPAGTPHVEETAPTRNTVWRRFRRHRVALVGVVVIGLMALIAIFANFLAPANPDFIDQVHWQGYPLAPGVAGHILGTDENGRDLLARLMFGARISLTVALFAVIMEISIGTFLGAISGYYGGWVDFIIMRVTDVVLSIPLLPLLLVLTAIVAATSNKAALSFGVIVLIIGGFSWPPVARLVRASFLSLREREFAEAAKALGNRDGRIIFRHLLPNADGADHRPGDARSRQRHHPRVDALVPGLRDPAADRVVGQHAGQRAVEHDAIAPWAAIFPGLCILVTVLAINYLGDGLRDALDPNMP